MGVAGAIRRRAARAVAACGACGVIVGKITQILRDRPKPIMRCDRIRRRATPGPRHSPRATTMQHANDSALNVAVTTSPALGDSLLLMTVARHLQLSGRTVALFSQPLTAL